MVFHGLPPRDWRPTAAHTVISRPLKGAVSMHSALMMTGGAANGRKTSARRDGRWRYSCVWAWMAVMATVLTISATRQPRLRSLTGLLRPCSTGPTATALAERWTAL